MIKYNCPKCQAAMQADDQQLGSIGKCPSCQGPVQVPAKPSKTPLILSFLAGGLTGVLSMCMCGVLFTLLSGVAVNSLGKNANSAFGTVGSSIGSTVSGGGR